MQEKATDNYRIEVCSDGPSPGQVEAVQALLLQAQAFEDQALALPRAQQTLALAYSQDGTLVAQLSAEKRFVEQLCNRFWAVSVFVLPEHRHASLSPRLTRTAFDALEGDFLAGKNPDVIGMFMVVQTRAYSNRRDDAVTPAGYMFIGRNRRGDNMRVRYFGGAMIDGSPPRLDQPGADAWLLDERYRVEVSGSDLDSATREAVAEFLLAEGAVKEREEALRRSGHTLALAYGPDGQIVGQLETEPYYFRQLLNEFWRIAVYVSKEHRRFHLARHLLLESERYLEQAFLAGDNPQVVGIYLRMQSPRLRDNERPAVSLFSRLVFVGRNPRGDNLRIYYFPGARIASSHVPQRT